MFGFNLLRKILKLFILKNRRIECFDFKIETKIIKKLKLQFNTILIMSWKIVIIGNSSNLESKDY